MEILPVSATRLHGRQILLRNAQRCTGSLFPFFDHLGRTEQVMVVEANSPRISMIPWAEGAFSGRWFAPSKVQAVLGDLRDLSDAEAATIRGRLWHHDPWWVLADSRFEGHPAVPHLKATNAVEHYRQPVKEVYFRRDLSHVHWLYVQLSDGPIYIGPKEGFLPQRPPAVHAALEPQPAEWRLKPFW